jgi:phosphoribosylamine--glycine ligase
MGAYSPVGMADAALLARVERDVLRPTLEEMARRRAPFSGVLYAGLMIDGAGTPNVIEFNCRLGDPEAQVMLPRIGTGFLEAVVAAARGDAIPPLLVTERAAVTTVLAAAGYPDAPVKGAAITIPDDLPAGTLVFHAGTRREEGILRASGGRVLAVTGLGATFGEAQRVSAQAAERIQFEGKQYRRDIGWREAARVRSGSR